MSDLSLDSHGPDCPLAIYKVIQEIRAMEPGRQLDSLVARGVLGREVFVAAVKDDPDLGPSLCAFCRYGMACDRKFFNHRDDFCMADEAGFVWVVPKYSVVEHIQLIVAIMKGRGFAFSLWDVPGHSSAQAGPIAAFQPGIYPPERTKEAKASALGRTIPHAVCLAALIAVEVYHK